MKRWRRPAARFASGAVIALLLVHPVLAQTVADFYHGKTISLVMGTGPGGSYDLYGLAIAKYLARHIPGNPSIIIEHMPGAGGVVAANNIYKLLPQDGTQILLTHVLPMIEKLTPSQGVRFESAKFNWLGTYSSIAQVFAFWHTAGVQTVDDLRTKPVVVGTFNKTHLTYQWSMLVKNALAAKYKVITGYPSGNELNLAMERGEIGGWVASWANLVDTKPDWLRDGSVSIPLQLESRSSPGVAECADIVGTDAARQEGRRGICQCRAAAVAWDCRGTPSPPRPRCCVAQGIRRLDGGQGLPGRSQEARFGYRAKKRCANDRASEKNRVSFARTGCAGQSDDRPGRVSGIIFWRRKRYCRLPPKMSVALECGGRVRLDELTRPPLQRR